MGRSAAMGILITLAACGSNKPTLPRAEYCDRQNAELCRYFQRCGLAAPDAGCAAVLDRKNNAPSSFIGTCSLDGPAFERDAAEACLAEVREWGCGDQLRSRCDPAARAVGAPCTVNCAPGLTCVGACGHKTCQPACKSLDPADCVPSGIGGPCSKGCKPGLRCVAGLCEDTPRVEELTCQIPEDCTWSADCKYTDEGRRCSVGGSLGSRCGRCLRGLVCSSDSSTEVGECLRLGDLGETCKPSFEGRDCITGATCFDGGCRKENDEGGPCPCVLGVSCINGQCVRERRPAGMECDTLANGQCDTGLACLPSGDAGAGSCTPFTYTPPPQPMTCP